jgi:hypothetical protein
VNKNKDEVVLEIKNPELDDVAIIKRIQQQVAERRASGSYPVDPSGLGPKTLLAKITDKSDYSTITVDTGLMYQILDNLMAGSRLQEQQFTSSVPLVGPFIATLRRMWNWMSTKWYVLPLLKQQSEFNEQAVFAINQLMQSLESVQQETAKLQTRISKLERGEKVE